MQTDVGILIELMQQGNKIVWHNFENDQGKVHGFSLLSWIEFDKVKS